MSPNSLTPRDETVTRDSPEGGPYVPKGGPLVREPPFAADVRDGYFTAPAVSPATTWRWKMMYAASTGSIAITRPAKRPDQSPL